MPGSSDGIVTEGRAGWSGIESRWRRDFPPAQTGPGAHPVSCKMGTGSFPVVNCVRGVLLTTHPLPRSWKSRAISLPTLCATPGLYRNHFTFTFTSGHLPFSLSFSFLLPFFLSFFLSSFLPFTRVLLTTHPLLVPRS